MSGLANNANPFQTQVRIAPVNIQLVPGPPGPNGQNAIGITTTSNFTQPAVSSSVNISVTSTSSLPTGLTVFVQGAGYMSETVIDGTTLSVTNLGSPGNASPGTVIGSGAIVVPAGAPASALVVSSNGGAITQRATLDLNGLAYADDPGGNRMRFFQSSGAPSTGASFTLSTSAPWGEIQSGGTYTLPASPIVGQDIELVAVSGEFENLPCTFLGNGHNVTDPYNTYSAASSATGRTSNITYRFRYNGSIYRWLGTSLL